MTTYPESDLADVTARLRQEASEVPVVQEVESLAARAQRDARSGKPARDHARGVVLVLGGLVAALVLSIGVLVMQPSPPVPRQATGSSVPIVEMQGVPHGVTIGLPPFTAFEEPGVDGVELTDALAKMLYPVRLPPEDALGGIVKVLQFTDTGVASRVQPAIAIRYGRQVMFEVRPLQDLNEHFGVVSRIGQNYRVEESPDPQRIWSDRVEAYSRSGFIQRWEDGETNIVPTMLVWNYGDYTYELHSYSDELSLDDLRRIMRSSRPAE